MSDFITVNIADLSDFKICQKLEAVLSNLRVVFLTFNFLFCLIIELATIIGASAKSFRFITFHLLK